MSGHVDGSLRVWNKAMGRCDQALQGHTDGVLCLASWEQYLVSGSNDHTIRVWDRGGARGSWPCLGTVSSHTGMVRSVIVWNGRVISGSDDKKIMVHSIASRQHEFTLDAHNGGVFALAVSGEKL